MPLNYLKNLYSQRKASQSMVQLVPDMIKVAGQRLPDIEDPAFGQYFDTFTRSRVVLIGDAR